MKYRLDDVFNEAGTPNVTFVEPKEFKQLCASLQTKGKHITLCGPSGCGKTTLAKNALSKSGIDLKDCFLISGREYTTYQSSKDLFAKVFGCVAEWEEIENYLAVARVSIIDDFHHLHYEVKTEIGRRLKLWHEKNIRFLIIGIASSTQKLLQLDPELGIRNDPYEMGTQSDAFVGLLVSKGEDALNIKISETSKAEIVQGSKGIPSVVHTICRIACIESDVLETQVHEKTINFQLKNIKELVLRSYHAKYFSKIVGLAKGKQQARSVHNTYYDIVAEIAQSDKSDISFQELYQKIVGRISDPVERSKKSTSFYNCLNYLQSVIEERNLEDAIFVDDQATSISIDDPSFRFYLSLIELDVIKKSLHIRSGGYPYDVAVSFAKSTRARVSAIVQALKDKGLQVFYDFDEQHRLWGKDLRHVLTQVYSKDARYMIVFLSQDYPERDWPSFELTIGKDARDKRTQEYLLPILMDDVHVVGLKDTVGYLDGRLLTDDNIVEHLVDKISEES